MANVAIVGAGKMGSATAWPLADNGHDVRLVGTHLDAEIIQACLETGEHPGLCRRLPAGIRPYYLEQLAAALDGVDLIVSGVNSLGVHWAGRTLAPFLRPGMVVLAVTKGLEAGPDGDLRILPDVLASELPATLRQEVVQAAIAGPCLAAELAARRPSAVIFTAPDEAVLYRLRDLFHNDYYHVWLSTDVVGVEACAALKNAYTVGVGAAGGMLDRAGGPDELGVGMHNLVAAVYGASAWEMSRILDLMGGRPERMVGLSWAADHFVTVTGGRTYRLGRLLGQGLRYTEAREQLGEPTLEGAFALQQMDCALQAWEAQGRIGPDDLPLMRMLCRTITQDQPLTIPWPDLYGTGQIML
jgi:glycerol-3-phosphate dehydrogenase (NAD(P)+)